MSALTDSASRATAKVAMKYKVNLGNYENCDVDLELSEVAAPGETGEQLLDRLVEVIETKLAEKVNELRK